MTTITEPAVIAIIDAIKTNRPHLAAVADAAQTGDPRALKQLADNVCRLGGNYLTPLQWLEVSRWGILPAQSPAIDAKRVAQKKLIEAGFRAPVCSVGLDVTADGSLQTQVCNVRIYADTCEIRYAQKLESENVQKVREIMEALGLTVTTISNF